MSGADIMRELIAAQADVGTDTVLTKFGVSRDVTPVCGIARVRSHGPFFEPDPNGEPAIILPVMDDGEVADLVAVMPHRPGHWRVRLGACPLLGIDNTGIWSEPLHVWRTPLDYLRAELEGVVVLSWPAALPLLRSCSEIIAEDVEHGREIHRRLSHPIADLRFRRQVKRLHARGPRVVAELLAELGAERGIQTIIDEKVDRYASINDAALDAIGGREFPPIPLHAVK